MIPDQGEPRATAKALAREGRAPEAVSLLRAAVDREPGAVGCWLDLAALLDRMGQRDEAVAAVDAGLAATPHAPGLMEAKALLLRLTGDAARTEAFLVSELERREDQAWAHFHLGDLLAPTEGERGERHLRRAVELAPDNADMLFALMQRLERASGADEGRKLDEAHQLARRARKLSPLTPARHKLLRDVFVRTCDHEALAAMGDFAQTGRAYAQAGLHTALLRQLARVTGEADRRELLEQHRIWGRKVEAQAQGAPVPRPPRAGGGRIRLGFLSSDLHRHPVGYFAAPLFDRLDRDRFELFVYSFSPRPADDLQARIAAAASAYRQWPGLPAREAGRRIAADGLDMLIELGGSTSLNKVEVLAFRPAPVQASWLGYPHSAGLESIDYFICDPFNRPASDDLLVEAPLVLPNSWVALGEGVLPDPPLADEPPSQRNGFVTFGTANQPYKYGPDVLRTWARVVAATPEGRFLFLRPEAASAVFRRNVEAAFAREGVGPERILWRPVRGGHLPIYGEIDISLDTFPLTGGTTTIESLWMGTPVVALTGPMFHERLSHSLLHNVGLPDLSVETLEAYEAAALGLARDVERRRRLRRTLRASVQNGPVGQSETFARDFYAAVERVVLGT